jgi:hypothetical protein
MIATMKITAAIVSNPPMILLFKLPLRSFLEDRIYPTLSLAPQKDQSGH